MKRLLLLVIMFMLSFSLFRVLNNKDYLSVDGFLNSLSYLDYDFDQSYNSIMEIRDEINNFGTYFTFEDGSADIISVLKAFFKSVLNFFSMLFSAVKLVIMFVADVISLLVSVFYVIGYMLGLTSTA